MKDKCDVNNLHGISFDSFK